MSTDVALPQIEPPTTTLGDELASRRTRRYLADRRNYRQDHPRASSISQCAREMYHQIIDWRSRPEFEATLLQRFRRGHEIERLVVRELLEDGWDVEETQSPFEIKEEHDGEEIIILTGHMDGRIGYGVSKPVCEIKSVHPFYFTRVNCIQDYFDLGSFWAKYPLQLLMYLYACDEPMGVFILDDCLGHLKVIECVFDEWLEETEGALKRCRAAAIGARDKCAPDFTDKPEDCRECWARRAGLCFPPMDFSGAAAAGCLVDEDLEVKLERLHELRDGYSEYAAIDRRFKATMKTHGVGQYVCGHFLIDTTAKDRTAYDVPPEVKKQYEVQKETITTKWRRVGVDDPPVKKS